MSPRRRGLIYSLAIVFNRVVPSWLFRIGYWRVYRLDLERLIAVANHNDVKVKKCAVEDQAALGQATRSTSQPNSAGYAIRLGAGTEIVGGAWLAGQVFPEQDLGIAVELASNQRWLFSAYVAKEHRGRGLYRQCLRRIALDLREEPEANLLCAVNPFNRLSSRAHREASEATVGSMLAIRVGRIGLVHVTNKMAASRSFVLNCRKSPISIQIKET